MNRVRHIKEEAYEHSPRVEWRARWGVRAQRATHVMCNVLGTTAPSVVLRRRLRLTHSVARQDRGRASRIDCCGSIPTTCVAASLPATCFGTEAAVVLVNY